MQSMQMRRQSALMASRVSSVATMHNFIQSFKTVSMLDGRSFFVFRPDNGVRLALAKVTSHKWFEYAMIGLILGSAVCLTMDTANLDRGSSMVCACIMTSIIACLPRCVCDHWCMAHVNHCHRFTKRRHAEFVKLS